MAQYKFLTLFNGIDQTQTGGTAGVGGYRRVGIQLKSQLVTSGSGLFKFQGTVDGATWTYLNVIDNLANTNAQTLTRVASKTLNTNNASALVWIDEALPLRAIRLHLTWATDGSYSAYLLASE